jgi:hypothetical protein
VEDVAVQNRISGLFFLFIMLCLIQFGTLFGQDNRIQYTTYYFYDSGENTVSTTAFSLVKKFLSQTFFLLDIELDNVRVPPIDAATGASRPQRNRGETFEKTRGQVIIGVEQGLGPTTSFALNLYRSQEVDYLSNSAIVTLSQDFFQRNTTITVQGQFNDDRVGKITETGSVINSNKRVYTGAVNVTQILSKTTVLNLSYDGVYMEGFLSDPYRQVEVFDQSGVGDIFDESHPKKRTRQAGTVRLKQFIVPVDASFIGSYRYYFDDWDVSSHTIEFKMNKYVFSNLIFSASYRYYKQSGAEFYQERYTGSAGESDFFKTDDYKLKPFGSNNYGLSLRYLLRGLAGTNEDLSFLDNSSIEFQFFRYINDLDFSANIFQGSIKFAI